MAKLTTNKPAPAAKPAPKKEEVVQPQPRPSAGEAKAAPIVGQEPDPRTQKTMSWEHVWNTEEDAASIMIEVMRSAKVEAVLEIGTCIGKTTKAFACEGFKVVTTDVTDMRHPDVIGYPNVDFVLGGVDKVVGTFQAAFIDGDHSYEGVAKDFKACEALGIHLIFIHDAQTIEDVKRFVHEQLENPHYYTIILDTSDGDGLAIIRRK